MRFLLIILASIIATAVSAPPSAHSGQLVKRLDEDLRGLVPDGQKFEDVVRAKCQRCMGMCLDPELMGQNIPLKQCVKDCTASVREQFRDSLNQDWRNKVRPGHVKSIMDKIQCKDSDAEEDETVDDPDDADQPATSPRRSTENSFEAKPVLVPQLGQQGWKGVGLGVKPKMVPVSSQLESKKGQGGISWGHAAAAGTAAVGTAATVAGKVKNWATIPLNVLRGLGGASLVLSNSI